MADNKYRKELDRRAVLHDEKIRIIDLLENGQALPDVDIYDEPLRYFKANEQWCKVIFGWLAWLEHVAGWPDAEDENYAGIQAILTFEEGIEAGMATKDDIRDGMYEAMNRLAAQIVSGRYTDIAVDGDGVVTDPSLSPDGTPVEDDPDTEINETAAARMGGAISIGRELEKVWDKIDALFGVPSGTVTPVTPMADAQTIMKQLYVCEPVLMDTAVDNYYTWRLVAGGANTQIAFTQTASFSQFLYCNGWTYESLVRWIVDFSGWTFAKQQIALKFWESLGDEFYSVQYTKGSALPSTLYLEASCVPSPTEVINVLLLGTTYNGQQAWKSSHRLLFTVENYFTDSLGNVVDFWWYDATGATLPVSRISSVSISLGTGITKPTTNQVPFSATHKYQFTIDTPTASGSVSITVPSTGMTAPITASAVGVGIKVTIEDLGEYL